MPQRALNILMLSATARKDLPLSCQLQPNSQRKKWRGNDKQKILEKNDVIPMWRRKVTMPPRDMVNLQNDITWQDSDNGAFLTVEQCPSPGNGECSSLDVKHHQVRDSVAL